MKAFALAISLLVSAVSMASEVKIYEAPAWQGDTATAEFTLNEKLGRVWVTITVSDRFDVEDMGSDYRTKVEGLSYDAHAKAAYLDIDGQLVECAVVKQRGVLVFRHNYLKATNCSFKSKLVTKMVDDGFEIKKKTFLEVYLVTKE